MKTGMKRSRINQMSESQLFNPSKPLKPRVFNQREKQPVWDADKSMNRIVEYFSLNHWLTDVHAKVGE
jgi:hypothetical protein